MRPLQDTQSLSDTRNLRIHRVGVRGLRYPVTVQCAGTAPFRTVADAALTVDLPAEERGTHMSRFVEVLHAFHHDLSPARMHALADALRTRLGSGEAQADLRMTWFTEKSAPVSGQPGMVDCDVTWSVRLTARGSRLLTTVAVPVATLCPCSKAISERGAHNQRGCVTLTVDAAESVTPPVLIALVEASASCELYSLLKRPDEKAVTERAYDNPAFVEDVVREVATRVAALPGVTAYRVEAENFESIHNHNAIATIEGGL